MTTAAKHFLDDLMETVDKDDSHITSERQRQTFRWTWLKMSTSRFFTSRPPSRSADPLDCTESSEEESALRVTPTSTTAASLSTSVTQDSLQKYTTLSFSAKTQRRKHAAGACLILLLTGILLTGIGGRYFHDSQQHQLADDEGTLSLGMSVHEMLSHQEEAPWFVTYSIAWDTTVDGCLAYELPIVTATCSGAAAKIVNSTGCDMLTNNETTEHPASAMCLSSPSTVTCRSSMDHLGLTVSVVSASNYSCFKELEFFATSPNASWYKGGSVAQVVYVDMLLASGQYLATGNAIVCNQTAISSGCSVTRSCRENVFDREVRSTANGGFYVAPGSSEGCTVVLPSLQLMVPDNVALNAARQEA